MRRPNLDDSDDLTPSEAHVAAVWPLMAGERVTVHGDRCPAYDGDECRCRPLVVIGPTCLG